ncbi:MAG: DNA polymerase III subunit gamma/tau [Verrucomicrobiota bacterium]
MSYQVFARKYRPKTFADVLGQDHVVQTLRNAIEQNRIAQAYLFVGPRGTGKTSTARILAKALNCPGGPQIDFDPEDEVCREIAEGRSLDVLEIDGASNNSVDQIRDLRETVRYAPSSGNFKIYYIDEVHMLTTQAFNALLKTLEEPPPHVKFLFATTEPNKILPTIISRCQRFDLRRIPTPLIARHLLEIAQAEGITLEEAAAYAVAKGAEGGMRDAQSMLDQLVAFCGDHIAENDVLEIFGFTSQESVASLVDCLLQRRTADALHQSKAFHESGKDLSRLLSDLISHLRDVLVQKVDPQHEAPDLAPELRQHLARQAEQISQEKLLHLLDVLSETETRLRWASHKKLHLEMGLVRAVQTLDQVRVSDVITFLDRAAGGQTIPLPAAEPAPPAPKTSSSSSPLESTATQTPPPTATTPAETPSPGPAPPADKPKKAAPKKPVPALAGTPEALWRAVIGRFSADGKGLIAEAAQAGQPTDITAELLEVSFPESYDFQVQTFIAANQDQFEALLQEFGGSPRKLVTTLSAEIAPPPPLPEEDLFAAAAPPAPREAQTESPSQKKQEADGANEEDFYQDPKIDYALKEFDGRLRKS